MKKRILLTIAIIVLICVTALVKPKNVKAMITSNPITVEKLYIYQNTNSENYYAPGCLEAGTDIVVDGILEIGNRPWIKLITPANINNYQVWIAYKINGEREGRTAVNMSDGSFSFNLGKLDVGTHTFEIVRISLVGIKELFSKPAISISFGVRRDCENELRYTDKVNYVSTTYSLCDQVKGSDEESAANLSQCIRCFGNGGIWTALGCIPTDPTGLIQTLIKIGLMVGGGIATLIILAGGFMLSISQGDPKKTSEAKEMISAAVIGLIFIVFSISILQLIGVQILQIPGFGE